MALGVCKSGANLTGANLTGATLTDADLTGTLLMPNNQFVYTVSTSTMVTFPLQSLPGATSGPCTPPSGSTFPVGANTVICQVLDDHGDVAHGTFTVSVTQVSTTCKALAGCNLTGADFGSANFIGADLQGANLQGANLSGANLSFARTAPTATLTALPASGTGPDG